MALLCLAAAPARAADPRPDLGPLSVQFRDGRLSVEAREQPLPAVLAEISRKSGITFQLRQPLPADPVSVSFRNVPAETAIKRLLGPHFDLVWAFDASRGKGSEQIAEVWVMPRGSGMALRGRPGKGGRADAAPPAGLKERLEQIEALAKQDAATALPALVGFLNDQDPQVRAAAAEALGDLGQGAAVEPLGQALRDDADPEVREAAAVALGELGSPQGVAALQQALRDSDADVRAAVLEALSDIGGVQAERAIRQGLGDQDEDVREAAEDALARLRQERK